MSKVELTVADSGREISVRPADEVRVSVHENPTTGYRWMAASMAPDVVELQSSSYSLVPDAGVGGGGVRTFVFTAKAPGRTTLELNLRQPWEPEVSPELRFDLTIEVQ